ncbi:DNA-J related domain-containing protein [Marinobacter sp. 2_MG-2023]|uniref:DNA-J related domain-containing protein n=1 Tax=Marinobacter sp. 2_MG-2023 TaxID=3062679 RepID=UPI0026E12658|nr:DNA-J related domain-containing protein [Marinobacter sp. 2_MG-2023]MDO6440608.1 DNA-J related domain-containing protein [Marinobacter sp. 2_MG-2023]
MKNTPASPERSGQTPLIESGEMLEQQIQHLLIAVEHELRVSPNGTDELNLIKRLQRAPWCLVGDLEFNNPSELYPVHFLLFHVLYRLRDTLAKAGESLTISPMRISIDCQKTVSGDGLPDAVDNLRSFYLDLSQYELPKNAIEQMMERFWAGYQGAAPSGPEVLAAANTLGFEAVPDSFSTTKQAFRRAVMQAHPDRGGETEAIQTLNEAFSVLKTHFSQMMEQT